LFQWCFCCSNRCDFTQRIGRKYNCSPSRTPSTSCRRLNSVAVCIHIPSPLNGFILRCCLPRVGCRTHTKNDDCVQRTNSLMRLPSRQDRWIISALAPRCPNQARWMQKRRGRRITARGCPVNATTSCAVNSTTSCAVNSTPSCSSQLHHVVSVVRGIGLVRTKYHARSVARVRSIGGVSREFR
jgi:hypothetical protein